MRKLIPALLISLALCLTLIPFMSGPTSAQEPQPPAPKGTDPLPTPPPNGTESPLPAQIDRTLLPKIEP
ncbi:MAG: hypothetical protein AB1801_15270, partial [Chloroflexota bacterium]